MTKSELLKEAKKQHHLAGVYLRLYMSTGNEIFMKTSNEHEYKSLELYDKAKGDKDVTGHD